MSYHTPTPWWIPDDEPDVIRGGVEECLICRMAEPNVGCFEEEYADQEAAIEADQDFILLACNNHADLVEALRLLLMEADALPMGMPQETLGKVAARAALAKIGGAT